MQIDVQPGNYKICAYSVGKAYSFVIVLSKTDALAQNYLIKIDELQEF